MAYQLYIAQFPHRNPNTPSLYEIMDTSGILIIIIDSTIGPLCILYLPDDDDDDQAGYTFFVVEF